VDGQSKIDKNLLSQRWAMLTNPHAGPIVGMMPWNELEIINHCRLIDEVRAEFGGPRFFDAQILACHKRFRKFCRTQWANRNRKESKK